MSSIISFIYLFNCNSAIAFDFAPEVGDIAPNFQLEGFNKNTKSKKIWELNDFQGKWLVMYLYPKDFTAGCTLEAKGFSELKKGFSKYNAEIVGISADNQDSHESFCSEKSINYTLLSDPEGIISDKYGSWIPPFSDRNTFLISPDGNTIADNRDTQSKPCYDQSSLMRRYELIKEICDCMIEMGWGPYQNDHEDANGQFEMNWDYSDCLKTADRHTFFKFMVKTIAEKHDLRATFMPKPFENLTGNGCHAHISLWKGKKNIFLDKHDKLGLSKTAYNFLGGIMKHASSLSTFFNPTINSYRRINAAPTKSGATWSPSSISYTGNNRTHMIRVPDPGRFELRLMDGSANPYLLQASVLAAGIEGLSKRINPGKPLFCNMYEDYKKYPNLSKLPNELKDSLDKIENNKEMNKAFGKEVIKSYVKLRTSELKDFNDNEKFDKSKPITKWERQNTLDC